MKSHYIDMGGNTKDGENISGVLGHSLVNLNSCLVSRLEKCRTILKNFFQCNDKSGMGITCGLMLCGVAWSVVVYCGS